MASECHCIDDLRDHAALNVSICESDVHVIGANRVVDVHEDLIVPLMIIRCALLLECPGDEMFAAKPNNAIMRSQPINLV